MWLYLFLELYVPTGQIETFCPLDWFSLLTLNRMSNCVIGYRALFLFAKGACVCVCVCVCVCGHSYIHQHVRCYVVSENWMCVLTCILINLKLNFIPKIVQGRHQYIWTWLICTEATVQWLERTHLWKVSHVHRKERKEWVCLQYWSILSLESLVISFLHIY